MPQQIEISTTDQVNICTEVFAENNNTTLIINPAIGVKRKLYHAFAAFMAEQGITTVIYNYRGMEDGLLALPDGVRTDAEAWGRLDQSAVINWAWTTLKAEKLFVLGHSIGGQLLGFADNFDLVDGLLHVTAQKGDYRLWPWWSLNGRIKLMLLWHVLIPWMSRGPTFNASKLGLGTYPWPAAAAKQWASWGRVKGYLFNPQFGFDLNTWHHYNQPLLSFGFTDDDMAPEAAIDGLLQAFGTAGNSRDASSRDNGHIEKRIIDPKSMGLSSIGHFGFFKPKAKTLWQETATWIHQQTK